MIGAGKRDRRLVFQRATVAQDDYGYVAETFAEYVTRWASRLDVSDAEKLSNAELATALMSRFVVLSDSSTRTLTTKDRFTHDGGTWNIHGVKETQHGRNKYIEITAVRRSD